MDNQQNQNQPGQSFQPGQSVQPGQQMPPQPAPQQYPNAYQQPLQQTPQAMPQQPYPSDPNMMAQQQVQALDSSSKLNVKKLALIGGVFLAGVIVISVVVALVGGGNSTSTNLTPATSQEVSFSVGLPEGWEQNSNQNGSFSFITATPPDMIPGDETAVTVTRTTNPITAAEFTREGDNEVASLASRDFENTFGVDVTQLAQEQPNDRLFVITYQQTSETTSITHTVERYLVHASDDSVINIRVAYTDQYPEVGELGREIADSVVIK